MRTANKWIVATGCAGLTIALVSSAFAQERAEKPTYFNARVHAPRDAFEIGVSAGYSQGTSSPAAGFNATDLTKAGGAFALQLGYRFAPEFALHLFGEYDEFASGNALTASAGTRGGVAGINGTFHVLPYNRIDPWVRVGVGYRGLWVTGDNNTPDTLWHGFQLAKVDIGADFRTSEDVAIGPTIGVDLSEFVWRNPTGSVGNVQIADKRVVPFVYAGLEGRFDIGGARVRHVPEYASNR